MCVEIGSVDSKIYVFLGFQTVCFLFSGMPLLKWMNTIIPFIRTRCAM